MISMFNHHHYVPIVRWKRGEQKALELMDPSVKAGMTPLIEIPPITWDFEKELPKITIDEHLSGVGQKVNKAWGRNAPIFVDAYQVCIEDDERMQSGQHPLEYIIDDLYSEGLTAIPVTGISRGANYQDAVKNVIQKYNNGYCLRLDDDDLDNLDPFINWSKSFFGQGLNTIDLLIDFKYIDPKYESRMLRLVSGSVATIPNLTEWRTFTICGTSFPKDLSKIPTGTVGAIRRSEWHIYKKIMQTSLLRYPAFGDYIISNPEYIEVNPRLMQMAAGIRYSTKDEFLVFRGYSIRNPKYNGWGQALELTKQIVRHKDYSGRYYSYGDEYIYNCSIGEVSTGSPEVWRRVGTNHHLTLVVNELSNLHGASTVHLS